MDCPPFWRQRIGQSSLVNGPIDDQAHLPGRSQLAQSAGDAHIYPIRKIRNEAGILGVLT